MKSPAAFRAALAVCLAICLTPAFARAQDGACEPASAQQDCPTPLSRSLQAIEAYVTAPARWDRSDWLYFGGALTAIGVAYHFDATVRTQLVGGSSAAASHASADTLQDALPAAALLIGTWGYANLIDDEDGRGEVRTMLEASALSLGTTFALSYAAGRRGPNHATSPNRWWSGGTSFPSEHTTAAFAIGTVLAESGNGQYRWLRRILGYGVAGFTAYERLHHNDHWLSDTVAGAALGAASARFAIGRRQESGNDGAVAMVPTPGGVMLTWTVHVR